MTSVSIPASVATINHHSFDGCPNQTDIYYGGSESQWGQIDIREPNEALFNLAIHYNSTGN